MRCFTKKLEWVYNICYNIRKSKQLKCGSKNNSPESFAKLYDMCHNNCNQGKIIERAMEHLDLINGTISFIPYAPIAEKIIIKRRTIIKRR